MSLPARALLIGVAIAAIAAVCILFADGVLDPKARPEVAKNPKNPEPRSVDVLTKPQERLPLVTHNRESERKMQPDQEQEEIALEWDQSLGPMDVLERLVDRGYVEASGAAHWRHSWLSICGAALSSERASKPNSNRVQGQHADLLKVCRDVLPADLDPNHPADAHALSSTLTDLAFEKAIGSTVSELRSIKRSFGRRQFLEESRRVLRTSLDTFELQSTIEQLYLEGELLVPEVDMLVERMSQSVISQLARDIAIIWFCDRIGGCVGRDHPLVLKRCFLSEVPCYNPIDINEAVYQVTPPIVYNSLRALEARVWRFTLSEGRE